MAEVYNVNNGLYVGIEVAEITTIPYYELINKNLDRANMENHVFFGNLLSNFYRKSEDGMTSMELMFTSVAVDNQTYKAQVRMHLVLRKLGNNPQMIVNDLGSFVSSIKNDFTDNFFDIKFLDTPEAMNTYKQQLMNINTSSFVSVTKREDALQSMMAPNGFIYHTFIPEPAENINTSIITNVLSQNPGSAIILQVIPTKYNQNETNGFNAISKNMQFVAGNMMKSMMRPDPSFQRMMGVFQSYLQQQNDDIYYFNFLVASGANSVMDIASKVVSALENPAKVGGSAYEAVGLPFANVNLLNMFPMMPWSISNTLLYNNRNSIIWGTNKAPEYFRRLKQLITAYELKSLFKIPIDDGKTIGIDSKKVLINREKLNDSIIMDGNFKVGVIKNAARNGFGDGAHAGIPLNQFTKHGLIVGMPGSGKTNFSLGLLLQFWRDFKIPFLAIEPTKTEYRSLIDAIPELQVFTPGKNEVSPFVINPFIPPRGVTVENYTPSLAAAFKASFSMPNPLPDIFLGAINDCYTEYGWKKNSTVDDPDIELFGMYEFIKVFKRSIEHLNYKGETKANIESAGIVRLISLIEQNSNIYDTIHTVPIEDLLTHPTVLELNAINNKEQKSLIMALMLILFCVYTKNNVSGDGKLKNVLLIDEAHVLLGSKGGSSPDGADSQGSTVETLEDLIKEIRSYGTSIIIADQSPTSVGKEIVANTDVKIMFKLVEKDNKDAVRTATNMSDLNYELLGRLGVGEALLHFGKLDNHLHIGTYNVHDRAELRDVIFDKDLVPKLTYWDSHQNLLMAHRECQYNTCCNGCCDLELRTNADFVATKLINDKLYNIENKEQFLKYLVTMNTDVKAVSDRFGSLTFTKRFLNCTKIKFLRKAMIKKDFELSPEEYKHILNHKNFLLK